MMSEKSIEYIKTLGEHNYIFLDVDGVLNCQLFYNEYFAHLARYNGIPFYKTVKKHLRKLLKGKELSKLDYYKSQMCPNRLSWLSELCETTNSVVVISASMRSQWSVEELQEIFNYCGATFKIIDKTSYTGYARGTEIHKWLTENIEPEIHGCHYFDFEKYVIIDDDGDFLIDQAQHLFQTDPYAGLTPTMCEDIRKFLTGVTFPK